MFCSFGVRVRELQRDAVHFVFVLFHRPFEQSPELLSIPVRQAPSLLTLPSMDCSVMLYTGNDFVLWVFEILSHVLLWILILGLFVHMRGGRREKKYYLCWRRRRTVVWRCFGRPGGEEWGVVLAPAKLVSLYFTP